MTAGTPDAARVPWPRRVRVGVEGESGGVRDV